MSAGLSINPRDKESMSFNECITACIQEVLFTYLTAHSHASHSESVMTFLHKYPGASLANLENFILGLPQGLKPFEEKMLHTEGALHQALTVNLNEELKTHLSSNQYQRLAAGALVRIHHACFAAIELYASHQVHARGGVYAVSSSFSREKVIAEHMSKAPVSPSIQREDALTPR